MSLYFSVKYNGGRNCTLIKTFGFDDHAKKLKSSLACNIIYSTEGPVRPDKIQLSTKRQRERATPERNERECTTIISSFHEKSVCCKTSR